MPRPVVPILALPRNRSVTLSSGLVVRRDQVRVGRDQQPLGGDRRRARRARRSRSSSTPGSMTTPLPITGHDVRREDAGGQQVQRVLLVADDDRVAGVVAALVADDVVDAATEQVGGLTLALIAPLGTNEHDSRHRFSLLAHKTKPLAQARQGLLRGRKDYPESGLPCAIASRTCRLLLRPSDRRFRPAASGLSPVPRRNCSTARPRPSRRSPAAALASAYRQRRKPRLGSCSQGIGPCPFQPPGAAGPGRGGSRCARRRSEVTAWPCAKYSSASVAQAAG